NGNVLTVGAANGLSGTYGGVIANGLTAGGGLVKAGAGTLTLTGTNTFTGATTVSAGTLVVGQAAGIRSLARPVAVAGGSLAGNGTVAGPVTVSSGTVSPGASPGKLTVTGGVTFTGGTFLAELNGTGQGTTYDWLAAGGAVALGGGVATLTTSLGF